MAHSFACKTNRIVTGVLQSIETITHTWSVSTSSQSALFKQEHFLPYGSTRVTCRNTLLNDSDDWRFVSQTCFHCQYYCISLCVQLVTQYAKWKKPLECEFWHVLSAYFPTLTNSKILKMMSWIFILPKLNIYAITLE